MQRKRNVIPRVGEVYLGWGKTWEVVRVWPDATVAEIRNVAKHANTAHLPFSQFVSELEPSSEGF